jgi:hypothetical protein
MTCTPTATRSAQQSRTVRRRQPATPRPPCPATNGNHFFRTMRFATGPHRICFFCGHHALPGEDPDDHEHAPRTGGPQ